MHRRDFLLTVATAPALAACAALNEGGALPTPVPAEEQAATLAAMRPPKRARPVIAVLLDNRGSETTDAIIPWSVLKRSRVAEVFSVALEAGPARMMPVLTVQPELTTAAFDAAYTDGADYVIVPALHDPKSPAAVQWIKRQSASGAQIVGVCAGGLTVGHAGLLEGRRGTTHWFHRSELAGISPGMTWVADRRYVADRGVITTTGVSASLPVSLALVEAVAGPEVAARLARDLGVAHHDARHLSSAFGSRSAIYSEGARNTLNLPGRRNLAARVASGVDEMQLALIADAWSRTYRGSFKVFAPGGAVTSRNGLQLSVENGEDGEALDQFAKPSLPGQVLERAIDAICEKFGASTARLVAHQLEVMWSPAEGQG